MYLHPNHPNAKAYLLYPNLRSWLYKNKNTTTNMPHLIYNTSTWKIRGDISETMINLRLKRLYNIYLVCRGTEFYLSSWGRDPIGPDRRHIWLLLRWQCLVVLRWFGRRLFRAAQGSRVGAMLNRGHGNQRGWLVTAGLPASAWNQGIRRLQQVYQKGMLEAPST